MSLITLLGFVIFVAVVIWLISLLPLDAKAKQIATVILILVALLWLFSAFSHRGDLFTTRIF